MRFGVGFGGSMDVGPQLGGTYRYFEKVDFGPAVEVGGKFLVLEIMDLNTGATGTFQFAGLEVGTGLVPLPADAELGNGAWKTFHTTEMSLNDFNDVVRFPSLPFGLFASLQFTGVDVVHDGFLDTLWYGDGVDISDIADGLNIDLEYAVGILSLDELRWEQVGPAGQVFGGLAEREHTLAEQHAQQSIPTAEQAAWQEEFAQQQSIPNAEEAAWQEEFAQQQSIPNAEEAAWQEEFTRPPALTGDQLAADREQFEQQQSIPTPEDAAWQQEFAQQQSIPREQLDADVVDAQGWDPVGDLDRDLASEEAELQDASETDPADDPAAAGP